jgi:hypothetical protein
MKHQNVFILCLNTQADMGTGSSQYNLARQELAAADSKPGYALDTSWKHNDFHNTSSTT